MSREITGFERMVFTKEWIKRGKPPTREEFIKRVCEVKGIKYTPAPYLKTSRKSSIDMSARMFPVKDKK